MSDVTRLLSRIDSGDPAAAEQLLPLVYEELRKLASARLARELPGQTLQATALVHEAYLRLVGSGGTSQESEPVESGLCQNRTAGPRPARGFDSRSHFFAAAAQAMRRILVEQARHKYSLKMGGGWQREGGELEALPASSPDQILDIDQALVKLAHEHPDIARLVELRYFAGLTLEEAADALSISVRTVQRHWVYAKAWLMEELRAYSQA
jgi:DNA-directed RNA polymerase specialized sigma24 family protein